MTMSKALLKARRTSVLAAALIVGACADLDIQNTNAPTVETLTGSPTRSVMALAATGIFSNAYNDVAGTIQYYALYGREGYNLAGNDPRELEEQISGPPDPAGRNSGLWTGQYAAIRTINTYLDALPRATGLSAEEVRASAGMAKTMGAWHFARLAVRTGDLGIPMDVNRPISDEPAPFVGFADAMAAVSTMLDEAYADLQAGGGSFPFTVGPGFQDGFDTPATFAEFNRALAAKVLVWRATFNDCAACWAQAQTALDASFVTDGGLPESLDEGVYYAYSTSSGEPANPVTEPIGSNRYWVHPSIVTGAQLRAGGEPDLRLTTKVMDAGRSHSLSSPTGSLTGTHKPVLYNDPSNRTQPSLGTDIPWIDNEELLLLRAEIRWHNGDRPGAIDDINLIREHAGGLEPTALTAASSDDAFITELLYNRLYSLMWAQGTRWIDARRYDRLNDLPIDRQGDYLYPNMIIPAAECAAHEEEAPCTLL
ncbi:MAG: RagB/SusD family nutrient uptake outer membrane protein [Longimicrobiales bacterium]